MSRDRERNPQGQFVETITLDRVRDVLADADEPFMATGDVADALDCSPEAARMKLTELADRGDVERRNVRGAVVIWWLADEQRTRGGPADPLFGLVGLFSDADDEAAARARERSEEWGKAFDEEMMSGVADADPGSEGGDVNGARGSE